MNKVIVVSDSHGLVEPLERIYDHFKHEVSVFLHCGDSELEEEHPIFKIYRTVRGNCDYENFPLVDRVRVAGYTILFTHGHHHSVKFNLDRLYFLGKENQADIVCFGHTHAPLVERSTDGLYILNPGSIKYNRSLKAIKECFVLIEFDEGVAIKFLDRDTFEVIEL